MVKGMDGKMIFKALSWGKLGGLSVF